MGSYIGPGVFSDFGVRIVVLWILRVGRQGAWTECARRGVLWYAVDGAGWRVLLANYKLVASS